MGNFFKTLFGSKPNAEANAIPPGFSAYASTAIQLVANSETSLKDEELISLLCANAIPHNEATELLLFLPVAFCRHMLPQIEWPAYYVRHISESKQIKVQYSENPRFLAIQGAMAIFLAGDFKQADFLKIAGRSASFHVINKLLLDGGKLEDISVTPEHVLR